MINKVCAIIVAGGSGKRYSGASKLMGPIHGICPLELVLDVFDRHIQIDSIVLVLNEAWIEGFPKAEWKKIIQIVSGGLTRQESVINGFNALQNSANPPYKILIHDAARPFVSFMLIKKVIDELETEKAVVPVLPVFDAIKYEQDGQIKPLKQKGTLLRTQTPQGFLFSLFRDTLEHAQKDETVFRDEIEMALHYHPEIKIKTIAGEFTNEKITTLHQLPLLGKLMGETHKTGIGYDFHYFQNDKPLILGGVNIPYEQGLEGDSDGDVLSHSILEGLLGALSLGDMGRFFGLGTPELKNICSISLFKNLRTYCLNKHINFAIHHIDVTLVALKPSLSPFIQQIQRELRKWLELNDDQINIKATTDKGMDAAGSGKGIRSIALVDIILNDGGKK